MVQSPILAYEFLQHGFEATTTYAGLPDFYDSLIQSSSRPIINWDNLPVFQNHQEQLARQMLFWESLLLRQGFRFYPSAVVGWDPIRRCEQGVDPEKAMPLYPYRPRMISTPDVFFECFWRLVHIMPEFHGVLIFLLWWPHLMMLAMGLRRYQD